MTDTQKNKLLLLIENWCRWIRSTGTPQGRCASIESRYVAPKLTEEDSIEKAETHGAIPINPLEAEMVEQCVHAISNVLNRDCLIAWHLGKREQNGSYKRFSGIIEISKHLDIRPSLLTVVRELSLGELHRQIELHQWRQHRGSVA